MPIQPTPPNYSQETCMRTLNYKAQACPKPTPLVKVASQSEVEPAMLYVAKEPAENKQHYYTLVGVSGKNVVQVAGLGDSEALFVDYIDKLLIKLQEYICLTRGRFNTN